VLRVNRNPSRYDGGHALREQVASNRFVPGGRGGDRVPAVDIRASDEDRQRVVAALERHTGAGRLTLDEFAERVQVACDARTLDELATVISDLPADSPPADDPTGAADTSPRRELLLVFAIAIVTLILLGLAMALRS
jgi:hypothetical protein